jgi:predicted transcriptional regulator
MDIITFVVTELNRRKPDWAAFSEITGMSKKTIERIAARKHDPRYSHISKLYELLKRAA